MTESAEKNFPAYSHLPLSKSEFGMWFAHKGKHILGKSVLLSGMETLMKKIDHHLKQELPLHAQLTTDERLKLLQEIR